jgi:hypothetical protein
MDSKLPCDPDFFPVPKNVSAHDYVEAVIEDLRYLEAWERGDIPLLAAVLKVRQIRRANPALHDPACV